MTRRMAAPTDKIDIILSKFNDYHDRLKFTIEYESSHCLNFLNLSLKRINDELFIDWFHKETVRNFRWMAPRCHSALSGTCSRSKPRAAPEVTYISEYSGVAWNRRSSDRSSAQNRSNHSSLIGRTER